MGARIAKHPRRAATALLGFGLVCCSACDAVAAEEEEEESESELSASLLLGESIINSGGPNVHGFGGGARAGYTFTTPFYVGALVLLHAGTTDSGESDVRHHAQDFGVEAGYGLRLPKAVVRPTLRGGLSWITTPRDVDGEFLSPHVGLGLTLLLRLGIAHAGFDIDSRFYTRTVHGGDTSNSNLLVGLYVVAGVQF
jgi:hypothetical protein